MMFFGSGDAGDAALALGVVPSLPPLLLVYLDAEMLAGSGDIWLHLAMRQY